MLVLLLVSDKKLVLNTLYKTLENLLEISRRFSFFIHIQIAIFVHLINNFQ
ncbi:hypothetical protein T190607A02C_100026 [Tenacibaculum sp. 190524A02b]